MGEKGTSGTETKKKKVVGFQVIESECIWMKAGVVNLRECHNAYDCYTCPFDLAMQRAMKGGKEDTAGRTGTWHRELDRAQGAERVCRHSLSGRLEAPKVCPMNYECFHCHFDQMLDDAELSGLETRTAFRSVSGFRVADGYYYHLGHAWALIEHGGRVRVGMDDFAARLLGPGDGLDLPPLGTELVQGGKAWVLRRGDNRATFLSPIAGTVLAVNQRAQAAPDMVHAGPYGAGWLFIVEPGTLKDNLKALYYGKESLLWIEKETRELMKLMGPEYERLAATGARVIDDLYGRFPEFGWDRLVSTFLRSGAA